MVLDDRFASVLSCYSWSLPHSGWLGGWVVGDFLEACKELCIAPEDHCEGLLRSLPGGSVEQWLYWNWGFESALKRGWLKLFLTDSHCGMIKLEVSELMRRVVILGHASMGSDWQATDPRDNNHHVNIFLSPRWFASLHLWLFTGIVCVCSSDFPLACVGAPIGFVLSSCLGFLTLLNIII